MHHVDVARPRRDRARRRCRRRPPARGTSTCGDHLTGAEVLGDLHRELSAFPVAPEDEDAAAGLERRSAGAARSRTTSRGSCRRDRGEVHVPGSATLRRRSTTARSAIAPSACPAGRSSGAPRRRSAPTPSMPAFRQLTGAPRSASRPRSTAPADGARRRVPRPRFSPSGVEGTPRSGAGGLNERTTAACMTELLRCSWCHEPILYASRTTWALASGQMEDDLEPRRRGRAALVRRARDPQLDRRRLRPLDHPGPHARHPARPRTGNAGARPPSQAVEVQRQWVDRPGGAARACGPRRRCGSTAAASGLARRRRPAADRRASRARSSTSCSPCSRPCRPRSASASHASPRSRAGRRQRERQHAARVDAGAQRARRRRSCWAKAEGRPTPFGDRVRSRRCSARSPPAGAFAQRSTGRWSDGPDRETVSVASPAVARQGGGRGRRCTRGATPGTNAPKVGGVPQGKGQRRRARRTPTLVAGTPHRHRRVVEDHLTAFASARVPGVVGVQVVAAVVGGQHPQRIGRIGHRLPRSRPPRRSTAHVRIHAFSSPGAWRPW